MEQKDDVEGKTTKFRAPKRESSIQTTDHFPIVDPRKMPEALPITPQLKEFFASDKNMHRNFFDILICTLAFCKGKPGQTLSSTLQEHFQYINTQNSSKYQWYFKSQPLLDEFEKILKLQELLIRDDEGYVQLTPVTVWKIYSTLRTADAVKGGSLNLAELFIAYLYSDQKTKDTLAEAIKFVYNQFVLCVLPQEVNLDGSNHPSKIGIHSYNQSLQAIVEAACNLAETSEVLPGNFSGILEKPFNSLKPEYQEEIQSNQPIFPQQPVERDLAQEATSIYLVLQVLHWLLQKLFLGISLGGEMGRSL